MFPRGSCSRIQNEILERIRGKFPGEILKNLLKGLPEQLLKEISTFKGTSGRILLSIFRRLSSGFFLRLSRGSLERISGRIFRKASRRISEGISKRIPRETSKTICKLVLNFFFEIWKSELNSRKVFRENS